MNMSKGKENKEANVAILKYLEQQNRPYSIIDIFNNLHKEFGKTLVQKTVENLAENGAIKEKTYGKQKVYVFNQDKIPTADGAELSAMDDQIKQLTATANQMQTDVNSLTSAHKKLAANMTMKEAKTKLDEITKECQVMEDKLTKLRDGQVLISEQEKNTIYKSSEEKLRHWRKRKRLATDILDAILEGYPKSKKSLHEDIGIETDEDYNVTMPKMLI